MCISRPFKPDACQPKAPDELNMPDFVDEIAGRLHTDSACVDKWKRELMKLVQSSKRSHTQHSLALWGFGTVDRRDLVMRVLRYVLKPRLIMVSHVSDSRFEGLLVTKCAYDEEIMSEWLHECNMGMGMHTMDTWMDESMVSCITRIEQGTNLSGNWMSVGMRHTRLMYQRLKHEAAERKRQQQVQQQTGMAFTTGNMLMLYHDRNNANINLSTLQVNYANLFTAYNRLTSSVDTTMQMERNVAMSLSDALSELHSSPTMNIEAVVVAVNNAVQTLTNSYEMNPRRRRRAPPPPPQTSSPTSSVVDLTVDFADTQPMVAWQQVEIIGQHRVQMPPLSPATYTNMYSPPPLLDVDAYQPPTPRPYDVPHMA